MSFQNIETADASSNSGAIDDPVADLSSITSDVLSRESADIPLPPVPPEVTLDTLPISLGEQGVGEVEALKRLHSIAMATPLTSGSRFVNQLFAGRERVATVAELLTGVLNNSMYTY